MEPPSLIRVYIVFLSLLLKGHGSEGLAVAVIKRLLRV